jgi:hypothetical protein
MAEEDIQISDLTSEEHVDEEADRKSDSQESAGMLAYPKGDIPSRRNKAFRRTILSRLPSLPEQSWAALEALDVQRDLKGIVDLSSDEFLAPLSSAAEVSNE